MRFIPRCLAASFLVAIGACPVIAQNSGIETISFGHRRPALGFVPCPPGILPSSPYDPTKPGTPGTPGTPNPMDPGAPPMGVDPGAQASLAGTGGGDATALPLSIGDQGAVYCVYRQVSIPTFSTVTTTVQPVDISGIPIGTPTVTQQVIAGNTLVTVCDPVASRTGAGFKIGDNESPRPIDRVFFTYNGYFSVPIAGVPGTTQVGAPITIVSGTAITTTTTTTTVPSLAARSIDIHRAMFGFEKTFLDGNASVGLRLPVFGRSGAGDDNGGFNGDGFGDMTLIAKYALINNLQNNNVLSTGLALTVPTGPAINSVVGNINSVLWQPYVGYIVNFGDAYLQGFSSVVVPTNTNDVVVMFNDVGVGFVAYRNFNRSGLTAIVPTIECHITTPLNHGDSGVVQVLDTVSLTGGVHLGLGQRCWLTLGANSPISGPRPYSVEGICQFNYRF